MTPRNNLTLRVPCVLGVKSNIKFNIEATEFTEEFSGRLTNFSKLSPVSYRALKFSRVAGRSKP